MEIKVQDRPGAPVPAGEPEAADIRKAVEEADLKSRIQSGEAFLKELARSAEENNEKKSRDKAADSGETRSGRDTAALSDESSYYKLSGDEPSALDRMWGEEEADLAWEDMLNWNPSFGKSVSDELHGLEGIYKELLLAILTHTTAGVKDEQLAMLDGLLSDSLIKMLDTRMGELEALLKNFGTENSMTALKAALYRSITGNALNSQELEQIFKGSLHRAQDIPYAKSLEGMNHRGNIHTPVNKAGSHGIIYQPAGEGRIKSNPQYAQRMQKEASVSGREILSGAGTAFGVQTSISSGGNNTVYSSYDLELAERFAGYMNHGGNLFIAPELSGDSEELYGYLAALMSVKSQTYITGSGIHEGLASHLREAMDRMIDFYLQDAFRRSDYSRGNRAGSQRPPFQPRAAYRIYYYMMNLYRTTGNLEETANKGLRQAYQQFLKKKEGLKADSDAGSFFTREKADTIEDWKKGKRFLENDWKEFLAILGRENPGMIPPGVLALSPWGIFAEPERSSPEERRGGSLFLMGAAAMLLLVILIVSFIGF